MSAPQEHHPPIAQLAFPPPLRAVPFGHMLDSLTRRALPSLRFMPAMKNGRPVRQVTGLAINYVSDEASMDFENADPSMTVCD